LHFRILNISIGTQTMPVRANEREKSEANGPGRRPPARGGRPAPPATASGAGSIQTFAPSFVSLAAAPG